VTTGEERFYRENRGGDLLARLSRGRQDASTVYHRAPPRQHHPDPHRSHLGRAGRGDPTDAPPVLVESAQETTSGSSWAPKPPPLPGTAPTTHYRPATPKMSEAPSPALSQPSLVGGGGSLRFPHTKNLSEKYFPTKSNCTRIPDQNSVAGYMRGVDWSKNTISGGRVYRLLKHHLWAFPRLYVPRPRPAPFVKPSLVSGAAADPGAS
jgi:hypothetical protein